MPDNGTVTVELPVTLKVSVAFPGEAPADKQAAAKDLANWFAGKVLHVSHAKLDACNEVNRVHPHAKGVVTAVDAVIA